MSASKMPEEHFVKSFDKRKRKKQAKKGKAPSKDRIRSEFVLQNAFSYLLGDAHNFNAINSMNDKEEDVLQRIKETIDNYRFVYIGAAKQYCTQIGALTEDALEDVLDNIFDKIFNAGITKDQIMAFFIVTGELCTTCFKMELPEDVKLIYLCFSGLVKRKLRKWIIDHGGWVRINFLYVRFYFLKSLGKPNNFMQRNL